MSDEQGHAAHVVYVWQWWHPDGSGWVDYRDNWPDVELARLHDPLRYNSAPKDLVVRLARRTYSDTEVPQ